MPIHYVFAGLVVTERDVAVNWYSRLFGKRPTFQPTTNEAVWQLAATASLYVLADPVRAGSGIVALAVDDLEAEIASINDRGILASPIQTVPGGRKAEVTDPDGNVITLVEVRSAP